MANIFKTTLKKDIIANIANDNQREVRFPITKFWATRLTDSYDLEDKTFEFKTFDSLELSSPSNKDTISETHIFDFVQTFVDGDEFVVEFKTNVEEVVETHPDDIQDDKIEEVVSDDVEDILDSTTVVEDAIEEETTPSVEITAINVESINNEFDEDTVTCDDIKYMDDEESYIANNEDKLNTIKQWFDENILNALYESEDVIATNARQVIVLPKGKVLGSKKTLPVNNDAEVRIEFDTNEKVYFDTFENADDFSAYISNALGEIKKNNFLFIWKRYTGIFADATGRIYFGIKYSTRKSIGFNRKYNVQ